MASRKEEKERLRKERMEAEKRESSAARKRLMLGYVVAGLLGLAVAGGIVFAIVGGGSEEDGNGGVEASGPNVNTTFGILPDDLPVDEREGTPPPEVENGELTSAAEAAGCDLQTDLPDEGATHLPPNADPPDYETTPPTSGDHDPQPLADGAFLEMPPMLNAVHSLEHGRIEIQYSPDLPEEEQLELKGLFDSDRAGILLFPNPDMPHEVAATAWTQLLGCESYEGAATLDALRAFISSYRGQGPENVDF